jgi:hypothetical protein
LAIFGAFWVKGTAGVANASASANKIETMTVEIEIESGIELCDQIESPTGLKQICSMSVAADEDEGVCWIGGPGLGKKSPLAHDE